MDRLGLPGQNQKGRLEDIFGFVVVVKHAPTNPKDQWRMTAHDFGEVIVGAADNVALEQLGVGRSLGTAAYGTAKMTKKEVCGCAGHGRCSCGGALSVPYCSDMGTLRQRATSTRKLYLG
jgi:hypothetical protein